MAIVKINHDELILKRIEERISECPKNWAKLASEKMGVKEITIYQYASGARGMGENKHVELLKFLNELSELNLNIKKEILAQ